MFYTSNDVAVCTEYLSSYGTNYKKAVALLPQHMRDATTILYAFVRYADEIIDNPTSPNPRQELSLWISQWHESFYDDISHHPILDAMKKVCLSYSIPYDYTNDFLKSMLSDAEKSRYETYAELEHYMWGSASVVGLIMCHIIGVSDTNTPYKKHAQSLGEAMQLTNFIRDIDEDYHDRNRVYIPQEWLDTYNLDDTWIRERTMTQDSRSLVNMMTEKAHELFTCGNNGITYLDARGQSAVLLSSRIYENILHNIKKNNYNVFCNNNNTRYDIIRLTIRHYIGL